MLTKIISGGQTGVDRGTLDAALNAGFPCGGWCPEDRRAEDGAIPDRYPVLELPGAGYRQRTKRNVVDSDGTLIIHFGEIAGGTRETLCFCERLGKPFLTVDGAQTAPEAATAAVIDFIARHHIGVLNVAGARESVHSGASEFGRLVVCAVLTSAAATSRVP